jgi:hypothetical protein
MGAVDERLCEVELSALVQVLRQRFQNAVEHAVAFPLLEATVTGLVRRVSARNVGPRRARAQHPEHAIEDVSGVAPRSAAARRRAEPLSSGNVVANGVPLLVGEVHAREQTRFRPDKKALRENKGKSIT